MEKTEQLDDRNLLLGLLALQQGYISRAALVRALQVWMQQKSRPLADLLVEAGDLSCEQRAALLPLVESYIQQNGDGMAASLAEVESARHSLQTSIEPPAEAHSSQRTLREPGDIRQTPASPPPATEPEPRYSILRPHAKGGLGEVFVARDAELNREVALKEIQAKHADDPSSRARFLTEAEITGGLEHPGIVPVYGMGAYPDGRPYYAMRFVRGVNLKEAIREYHAKRKAGHPAAELQLQLRHLLGRLIDVCNAIEYAHSRGVLHRDLKPGNIMLGRYGETLVVDWGLAKAQAMGSVHEFETPLAQSDNFSATATVLGTAVGTPPYMSPEQAAGRWDLLSPASDVYGLGATLYELLTGGPPVRGENSVEILKKVQRGEIVPVLEAQPTTPRGLAAICAKAMALKPEARYATAKEVADDLELWLADEPVTAWPEPWSRRAQRWLDRRRLAVSIVGIAALATLLLAAVVWKYQDSLARSRFEGKLLSRAFEAESKTAAAERRQAASDRYYSQVSLLRQRSLSRPLGWTWEQLDSIRSLRAEVAQHPETLQGLRNAALAALTANDLRPQEVLLADFNASCLAIDPKGEWLAAGEHHATFGYMDVKLLCLADRQRDRTLKLGQSILYSFRSLVADGITCLAFSSDGTRLAVGTRDGATRVFDLSQAKPVPQTLTGHEDRVTGLLFTEDDRQLLTSSLDQQVRFWDLATGECTHQLAAGGEISDMVQVGELVYLACSDQMKAFQLQMPPVLEKQVGPSEKTLARFPADGAVITGNSDDLRLWSAEHNTEDVRFIDPIIQRAHASGISQLAVSPTGRWLASTSGESVKFWDITTQRLVQQIPTLQGQAVFALFHPSRSEVFVISDHSLTRYELREPEELAVLAFNSHGIETMDVSPAGDLLLTIAEVEPRNDRAPYHEVAGAPLQPSGARFVRQFGAFTTLETAFSPDGKQLLISDQVRGTFHLLAAATGETLREKQVVAEPALPVFTPDAATIWCVAEGADLIPGILKGEGVSSVAQVDASSLKPVKEWANRHSAVTKRTSAILCIGMGRRHVAVASSDHILRIFKLATGELQAEFPLEQSVDSLLLVQGDALAIAGDRQGGLTVLRLADGQELAKTAGHSGRVTALVADESGPLPLIASGGADGQVKLWRLKQGKLQEVFTLPGIREIRKLRFAAGGKRLFYLAEGDLAVRALDLGLIERQLTDLGLLP